MLIINAPQFASDSLEERANDNVSGRRDFTQLMLEAINSTNGNDHLTPEEGHVTSVMLIITGTVTTSTMLTFITYVVSKHPDVKEKLFQELIQAMPEKNTTIRLVNYDCLTNFKRISLIITIHSYKHARKGCLPYLWAIIMEVSRMYPAIPGGLPRLTPDGGDIIAGQFIPGGVSGTEVKISKQHVECSNTLSRPSWMCPSGLSITMQVCLRILSSLNLKDG
jgi:cytochrome P450